MFCFILVAFMETGCARMSIGPVRVPTGPDAKIVYGVASWYGQEFHGRRTANGEIYNMYAHTAAHRSLPFGTKVRITNLRNGRVTVVRINDRGPFVRGRDIDLSYIAASELKMLNSGLEKVRMEIFSG